LSGLNRPSGHDVGMESPLTFGEINSFASDDDNDDLTRVAVTASLANGSTGSSNIVPQIEEYATIAEVEDLVNMPALAIGNQTSHNFCRFRIACGI
jgi:hypothetical protein